MARLFENLEAVRVTEVNSKARDDRPTRSTRKPKASSNATDGKGGSTKDDKGKGGASKGSKATNGKGGASKGSKATDGKGGASKGSDGKGGSTKGSKGNGKPKGRMGKCGRTTPRSRGHFTKTKGKKFRCTDLEWLKLVACFRPLWESSLIMDALIDHGMPLRSRGRERECRTFESWLLDTVAWRYGSYQWAADNLADPDVWNMLSEAVEQAYPYNRRMRLAKKPPSRSQNYRFRRDRVSSDLLKTIHERIELAAVQAMETTGMMEPPEGSLTYPDPYAFLTGDGCWLPALTSLTQDDAVDPETGEIIGRYDPDALAYHTHDGKASAPGHLLVMVQARNPYPNERIVLTTRLKSAHNPEVNRNDATIAVTALLEVCKRFPQLQRSFIGIVYDMALSTKDFDRLLEAGLIPVSKVPLTSNSEVACDNLGYHDFKTKDGQTVSLIVTAVNGMPCITVTDSDGIAYYQPLGLVQVKETERKKRPQFSTRRAIPDNPFVLKSLIGAETRIRHTRTKRERDAGESRSKALRIFAEADEQFNEIAPRRNDSESTNSDKKSRMWNRRCRTLRHESVEFNAISYQIHVLITALHAYCNRTGADMTQWFGQHQVPTKANRQARIRELAA